VAEVYGHAKLKCKVTGPIRVILAEDETKVKSCVCWEQKWDTLAGFCGPKENHVCIPSYKVVVGSGEPGYEKIVDSFQKDKIGGYARVIVVCSLHSTLPRLVLSVTCTCGCFDSAWIKRQWDRIDMLWIEDCLDGIGPILEHATSMTLRFENDAGSTWCLDPGKYRVFGNAKPTPFESIEVLINGFVVSTAHLSYLVRVKVESPNLYQSFLSESLYDDVVELKRKPSLFFPISKKSFEVVSSGTHIQSLGSYQNSGGRPPLPAPKDFVSLIDYLKKL
jgi:hypothetical protein